MGASGVPAGDHLNANGTRTLSFYGEDTDIARRMNAVGEVKFTFELKMFSSARRLKKEGMLTMAGRYTLNYLWTTFRKKPYTEEYLDIREQAVVEQKH